MTTTNNTNPRHSKRRRRPRSSDTSTANEGVSATGANKIIVIGLVAFCLINILDLDTLINHRGGGGAPGRRRSLLSTLYLSGPSTLLPWAQHHLVDVTDRPDPVSETALFWRELVVILSAVVISNVQISSTLALPPLSLNIRRHSQVGRDHRQTTLSMYGKNPRPSRRCRSEVRLR